MLAGPPVTVISGLQLAYKVSTAEKKRVFPVGHCQPGPVPSGPLDKSGEVLSRKQILSLVS